MRFLGKVNGHLIQCGGTRTKWEATSNTIRATFLRISSTIKERRRNNVLTGSDFGLGLDFVSVSLCKDGILVFGDRASSELHVYDDTKCFMNGMTRTKE